MVRQDDAELGVESGTEEIHQGASSHEPVGSRRLPRAPRSARSRSGITFLLGFLGVLFLGAGVALALSTRFSPKLAAIDQKVQALGFDHGSMILGGLGLFALAMVARRISVLERLQVAGDSSRADILLAIDQLATDSSQLLTSLLRLGEEVGTLSEGQKAALEQQRVLAERQGDGANDALFRLAASMDKLHARLDERFHQVDVQFRSRFESLQNTLHETRSALEQRMGHGETPRAALPKEETPRIEFFEALERMESERRAAPPAALDQGIFPSQDVDPVTGLLPTEVRRIMSRRDPS